MDTEPRHHRAERWRRFTILDLLLFQLGFALGFGLVYAAGESADSRPGGAPTWLVRPSAVELSIAGLTVGSSAAGLLVLLAQWGFRRRRNMPSAGEWLWLSPGSVLLLFIGAATGSSPVTASCVIMAVILLPGCLYLSTGVLVCEFGGEPRDVPCRWADRVGAVVALAGGLALIALLVMQWLKP
jgi:hypothetical protein